MLTQAFFDRDASVVAKELLGKVLCHHYRGHTWLKAQLIETEAYYLKDKASHASLGYTEKRKALFMPAGTIYMYYARGGDSFNISCAGEGNAVLIKSAYPYLTNSNVSLMQSLNPQAKSGLPRPIDKLCKGQTLLCKALGLKVSDWDQQQFQANKLMIEDVGEKIDNIISTTRLGIPQGRDGYLPYRFVWAKMSKCCTKKPTSSS